MTSLQQLLPRPDGSSGSHTLATIVSRCRRAISGPQDQKLATLQGMELFRAVRLRELRKLASLLEAVEIGPGERPRPGGPLEPHPLDTARGGRSEVTRGS
jgi:hypothetical protein